MSESALNFVVILLSCLVATKLTANLTPENITSVPHEILDQLQILQSNTKNTASKLVAYNQRFEQEFAKQNLLLLDMRKFYEEHRYSCVNSSSPNEVGTNKAYTSCADAMATGGKSGRYMLHLPAYNLEPFFVDCLEDPENGTAWTVVQRREDGSINFWRNWADYKNGFGYLGGEFFIGLDKLHALTHVHLQELWIQLEDFENATRFAKYDEFAIGNEAEKYVLKVVGKYHGDATDAFRVTHAGQQFTTLDQDNDADANRNCAAVREGGWWYHNCGWSNLNGRYLRGSHSEWGNGVNWHEFRGEYYSLKYVHMAIRPVSKKLF